ncbi:hypothetical protein OHA77_05965 [Streptosporangium sp. NBC_01639]|nr:hypothetical protein [Streptosporangium sp. NBC_01756]WSC85282.1 hypothetical protein OIE48_33770 [Streptosporangium sp. NBC_01756]WTD56088.1 hypothetical protein OHA77_05965 [Streptosporangium sp. NBC_01639]
MENFLFEKKPAFFPSATAELFFESENEGVAPGIFDAELDAELDDILNAV